MVDVIWNRAVDGHKVIRGGDPAKCLDCFFVHGPVPIWVLQDIRREHISCSGDDLKKIVVFSVGSTWCGVTLLVAEVRVVGICVIASV